MSLLYVDNILYFLTNHALYVEHIIDVPGIFVKVKLLFFTVCGHPCRSIHYIINRPINCVSGYLYENIFSAHFTSVSIVLAESTNIIVSQTHVLISDSHHPGARAQLFTGQRDSEQVFAIFHTLKKDIVARRCPLCVFYIFLVKRSACFRQQFSLL